MINTFKSSFIFLVFRFLYIANAIYFGILIHIY